jgi:hypothetical protein
MIAETMHYWPSKGVIAAASGASISFDLSPAECNAEADKTICDLDAWNGALVTVQRAVDIADPSASACHNCCFQLVCPAFWDWISKGRAVSMPGAAPAATGILTSVQLGNDGDLQTLHFSNIAATQPMNTELNLVTRRSIHGDFPPEVVGSECRITGASLRSDGRMRADYSTLLMPTSEIPQVTMQMDTTASVEPG